ncbi:MAG: hypothetical protein A3J29_02915 [Acidobacteria bacterium RIFCSPLOWO2_12_FULL_67_14b]|nr:MAG: hypothetical protein A3J29_02915 [Acidobacteria bacterium RIFCSPLOWO2_12_FULL_67_14b]
MEAGELELHVPKRKPIDRIPDDPDPLPATYVFTCEWYYREVVTGLKVADGHFYELSDATTTDHDPKHLRIEGVKYALHQGTGFLYDVRRDFTVLLKRHSPVYELYVRWRRFTCARWGW